MPPEDKPTQAARPSRPKDMTITKPVTPKPTAAETDRARDLLGAIKEIAAVLQWDGVAIDAYLKEHGVTHVDVIKMDIEGGESAALRGMEQTLRGVRFLFTEFAPAWIEAAGSSPLSFLESIEAHGFDIFAITPRGLTKLSPVKNSDIARLIPKPRSDSHASEFINLYCVKKRVNP